MTIAQVTIQALEDHGLIHTQHTGDRLGRELLTLDAGGRQQRLAAIRQPADAFGDHRFHACRQLLPVQRGTFHPAPLRVTDQITSLPEAAQQFHREERMALSVADELCAEAGAQAIGLGVQQRFDKLPAFAVIQINRPVTGYPLEFVDHRFQWVSGVR